jgi:dTDP-4-amino-4,6-dideoxygalactose transaminase
MKQLNSMNQTNSNMMKVPLIKPDLPDFETVAESFREILSNGKITNFGKYVTAFEEEASAYLGTHVATLSSCTMGLIFALKGFGLKPGQKVIVPSFTFMATVQAIVYAGGIPIFAEIDDDLNISLTDLEMLLAQHSDVGAVLPVHVYGLPCQVDKIQALVDEASERYSRKINILYDAAHGFGSAIGNRRVGSFGDAEVFSLSATKVVVSVEGGMVCSKDPDFMHRVRKMRNYGIEANYIVHYPGLNGKMSEFHAIVGLQSLGRLDNLLAERQKKARYYLDAVQSATNFGNLPWPEDVVHTFKDFTVLVPDSLVGRRDEVIEFLKERGVETRAYFFPPVHEQPFFKEYVDRPLPRTENLARKVITLPFYTTITDTEIDYVVSALADAQRSLA